MTLKEIKERLQTQRGHAARVALKGRTYEVRLRADGRVKAYGKAIELINRRTA